MHVKHILIDCTYFSAESQRYFRVDILKELFENVDSLNIIAFIKDINSTIAYTLWGIKNTPNYFCA